ncbi:hypothetical protein BC830DRAFT_1067945, partial [Chytriomyces sp. MP71]
SSDAIWLRDHCRCSQCFHEVTKQRLVDTHEVNVCRFIFSSLFLTKARSLFCLVSNDTHSTVLSIDWLRRHSYNPGLDKIAMGFDRFMWGSELAMNIPVVLYEEVMAGDQGLAKWLALIDQYGIAFVRGVPATCEATEALGRRISFIRETHYGAFWDFTANNAHADTAYTGLALQAHTDTTYFTDPIGLQLFHMTEFSGTGGKSLYVDGFHAAAQLQQFHPHHHALLSQVCIPTHSAGDPRVVMAPSPRGFPVLNMDPFTGRLHQVRFNNDDRSVLDARTLVRRDGKAVDVRDFYAALRAWVTLLRDAKNECWIQLEPGLAVIVDNWRVLHGRSAFTGHRRICGSYHGYDDYRSRVRDLCYGTLGRSDI